MTTLSTIMALVQYIAIAILMIDILFVSAQKPSRLQSPLLILLCSTLVMVLGYVIECLSVSLGEALLGAAVGYIGKPFVMLASWQFICAFYHRQIPRWLNVALFALCSSFFWIVYTNEYHYLYYATTLFDASQTYSPLVLTHGPLYNLYAGLALLYFVSCITIVIQGYRKSKSPNKKQYAAYIGGMVVAGILGYAVYLLDLTNGYDSTMLGIFVGVILLSVLFVRYRIFDVLSLAKNQALEDSSMGLLVLDGDDNVVYTNSAIAKLLETGLSVEQLKQLKDSSTTLTLKDRVYELKKKDLLDQGEYLGRSIEIQDITDSFNYQTRLEHDVKERTNRIEAIQRSIIVSFAEMVEARNMETGEHTARTMELVKKIAQKMKQEGLEPQVLTDSYIDMLSSAASLHDIGKISVPDSILTKPGRLTESEFEKIKEHTTAGSEVIEKTMSGLESPQYVRMCQDVAKYHHERWDGKGYPEGLEAEKIPLSARIMAVADVYDAVTNKRCYKEAMDKETAMNLIRDEAGSHFDPAVVKTFEKVIAEEDSNKK